MFAVVRIAGKQYTVEPKQVVTVDALEGKEGETLTFHDVLLVSNGDKTTVGTPTVKGMTVKAKIVTQKKGEKLDVFRYTSKVRHRRHIGFRQHLTQLEILAISKA